MSFLERSIESEVKWKLRLLKWANGDEVPERESVALDSKCDLGAWLQGDGRRQHGNNPLFRAACEAHTRFHAAAGHVVDLVLAGRREAAKRSILEGEYLARSMDLVRAIMVLKRAIG